LGHNFGSRHARRSSKGSINAADHLVSKKSLSQNFGPLDWRPGPVKLRQKKRRGRSSSFQKKFEPKFWPIGLASRARQTSSKKTHFASLSQANPLPKSKNCFLNRTKKTCRVRRGFEQLSSYSGWRVITKKPRANLLARAVVKGSTSAQVL